METEGKTDFISREIEVFQTEAEDLARKHKMSPESKKLFNVLILGVSFMFIFTAFQTCGNIAVGVNFKTCRICITVLLSFALPEIF